MARAALRASASASPKVYDAAIVGCGVVGAALARALSLTGLSTVVLEAKSGPFSGASGNNSGIVCTGFDAPLRSLERRCLQAGRAELVALARRGLEMHAFNASGSLIADFDESGWPEGHPMVGTGMSRAEAELALARLVDECADADDGLSRVMGRDELLIHEPGISKHARGAALVAGEVVFDPMMLCLAILREALANGSELRTSCRVVSATAPRPKARSETSSDEACGGWGEVDRAAAVTRARAAARALASAGVPWAVEAGRKIERRSAEAGGDDSGGRGGWSSIEPGDFWELEVEAGGGSSTTRVRAGMVFNCAGNGADAVDAVMRGALSSHYAEVSAEPSEAFGWRVRPRRGQYVVLGPMPARDAPDADGAAASGMAPPPPSSSSSSSPSSWRPRAAPASRFQPPPVRSPLTRPLQPLPSGQTKGVYIFPPAQPPSASPLVVVGPTAVDVDDSGVGGERWAARLESDTERDLLSLAERRLPGVRVSRDDDDNDNDDGGGGDKATTGASATAAAPGGGGRAVPPGWGVVGRYGGLRPAVAGRRDYRVRHEGAGWWTVAGVRSTGASASLGIARTVAASALAEAICAGAGVVAVAELASRPFAGALADATAYGDPGGSVAGARGGAAVAPAPETDGDESEVGEWWSERPAEVAMRVEVEEAEAAAEAHGSTGHPGSAGAPAPGGGDPGYEADARAAGQGLDESRSWQAQRWALYGRPALEAVFWGGAEQQAATDAALAELERQDRDFGALPRSEGPGADASPADRAAGGDGDAEEEAGAGANQAAAGPGPAHGSATPAPGSAASLHGSAASRGVVAGGAFDFGHSEAADALARAVAVRGSAAVTSGVSSALAAVAEAIESATGLAADDAAEAALGGRASLTGGSAMPSHLEAELGSFLSASPRRDLTLRSAELLEEYCSTLRQEMAAAGLDAASDLRAPSHMWPVTGSVTIGDTAVPVNHSLTRLVWAHRGGLVRPVRAGSDWDIAFGARR